MQGKVKWFKPTKGFGFIMDDQGQEYFVHYSSINAEGYRTLKEGQTVEFVANTSPKGLEAKEVTVVK
jgi:CspA family cold shock protein